ISPSASRKRIFEIVMSGNSGRSWPSTSPMLREARACAPAALMPARSPYGGLLFTARAGAGQVEQPELADLHLVPAGQGGDVDPLPVDVRPVEAAHVVHHEAAALPAELRVPAGDGHVVEEDVAVRVPAGGGDVLVEQEAAARVGPALDHQQRRAGRQRVDRAGVLLRRLLRDPALV